MIEREIYLQLDKTLTELKKSKPGDRSDKDRAVAITITDLEKIMAYYAVYVLGV
jgi:hypothetical protein